MSSRTFQYAKSTDPDVIAAVQRNADVWFEFRAAAVAFAAERGFDAHFWTSFRGLLRVTALPGKPDESRFGKYTKDGKPFRSNTAEVETMQACSRTKEAVPGLPVEGFIADGHDGFTLFVNPTPFLHDGAAWVVMDHKPREGEFGEQWVEVLASAAHAAREEYLGSAS